MKVKLVLIQCFEDTDPKGNFDPIQALYVNGKRIVSGDQYHVKIREMLEGIRLALDALGFEHELETRKIFLTEEETWDWQGPDTL